MFYVSIDQLPRGIYKEGCGCIGKAGMARMTRGKAVKKNGSVFHWILCAVRLFPFVFLYHQVERLPRRKLYGKGEGNGFGGEEAVLLNVFYS